MVHAAATRGGFDEKRTHVHCTRDEPRKPSLTTTAACMSLFQDAHAVPQNHVR